MSAMPTSGKTDDAAAISHELGFHREHITSQNARHGNGDVVLGTIFVRKKD